MSIGGYGTVLSLVLLAVAPVAARAGDSAKEQVKIRKITFDYAACVVKAHHAKASEAILATASNEAIMGKMSQIIDSDCLGSAAGEGVDMRFPNDTYQYALADALVNADFASHGHDSFADRLPLAQPPRTTQEEQADGLAKIKSGSKRKEAQRGYDKANALAWLARYGECVVREDPKSARYWLLTRPETPEEISRITAMSRTFSACLGSGTMRLNRITMRGTVAINYYRLAMATVIPHPASTH